MQTYIYHSETKEYLYSEVAFLDPLESEQQGKDVYLLPADATFTAPPEAKEGYARVWNGKAWEYVEDHRGVTVWQSYDESMVITELGAIPEGWSIEQPVKPATHDDLIAFITAEADRIAYGGITITKDCEQYLFKTTTENITLCNGLATALASMPDDTAVPWEVWQGNTPVMLPITKAEFVGGFGFGTQMIINAFTVKGTLIAEQGSFADEQLADVDFIEEFKARVILTLESVPREYNLDVIETAKA